MDPNKREELIILTKEALNIKYKLLEIYNEEFLLYYNQLKANKVTIPQHIEDRYQQIIK